MSRLNRDRKDNAIRVAEQIWRSPLISRAEIARRIRLDRSTTGSLVNMLIEHGLVYEQYPNLEQRDSPEGGRPPLLLALHDTIGFSIGIELSAEKSRITAISLRGKQLATEEISLPLEPQKLVGALVPLVARVTDSLADSHTRLMTVSLGISGMVDPTTGSIVASRDLNIRTPLPIADALQQELHVPVWLFNDADACALGELEYGPWRDGDVLFILANLRVPKRSGINVGLGIVLDGHLRIAHSGAGREFRSPFVAANSTEQFRVADDYYAGRVTAEDVAPAMADELGVSVAFLVHALDLRNIVLGGDLCTHDARRLVFEERIRHHIHFDTVRSEGQSVVIRQPTFEDRPVAFGAAAGGIRKLFEHRAFPIDEISTVGSRPVR